MPGEMPSKAQPSFPRVSGVWARARQAGLEAGSNRSAVMIVVPIALVLVTFLFWYQTWFGRRLTDKEMGQYLADRSVPHKTQHALMQLSERMARGDATAARWYPQLLALAGSRAPQLRSMAAWAMGQDNRSEEFHRRLRELVDDPEPAVRWNAALALVRFGDAAAEPQLRAMLQPFTLVAPQAGTLNFRLKEREAVQSGSIVARIRGEGAGKPVDVLSPLAGEVERLLAAEGAKVAAGDAMAVLSPGESQIWEALRALYLVGQPQDLEAIERFARGVSGMSERVRQQALLSAQAIRQRVRPGIP